MGSFRDLVKKVNEQEKEKKTSSFRDLVNKVNDGTIQVESKLNGAQVNAWYSGVKNTGKSAYEYLSKEGYKAPNADAIKNIDTYLSQAGDIGQYLRANKSSFSNYEEMLQNYHDTVSYLRDLKNGIESSNKFYSDFKDEEDYNFWYDHSTVENRQAWYEEQQAKIDDLGNYLDYYHTIDLWYQDYQERPWEYTEEDAAEKLAQYEKHKAYKQKYGSAEDVKREIAATEAEMRNYERGNYNENGRFYGSKVVDDNYATTQEEDFAITSANRDYDNPTKEEIELADAMNDNSTWRFDAEGVYRDAFGNELAVDENNTWYNPASQQTQVEDKLALYLNTSDDERVSAATESNGRNGIWHSVMSDGYDGAWEYLKDTEIGIYYTYLGESQEKAYKFLADMEVELNRRRTLDEIGQWNEGYEDATLLEKIALNAATVPAKFVSNIAGTIENTVNTMMGNDINPYSIAQGGMHFSQTIRGNTAEELNETHFKIPVIDFTLGDIYQTGMSRLDSALATSVFGGGGTVFLGMGAAQEEAYRLYQQGASEEQITMGAFAAGAAEAVFEYVSFDKLVKLGDADTIWKWVKNALIQGGIEASEETFTEVSNIITNAVIMGQQSDLAELHEKNGGDWFKTGLSLVQQTAQAAFGGFLGGLGAGATQGGASYINAQEQYTEAGEKIMDSVGGVDALKNLANEVAGVSDAKMQKSLKKQAANVSSEAASGKLAGVKNAINANKVGKLYNTLGEAYNAQNKADIVTILEMNKFSSETANAIADAVVALASGNLTEQQAGILEMYKDNEHVQGVINSYDYDERSSIGKRNLAMHQFEYGVAFSAAAKKHAEKTFTPEGKYAVSSDGEAKALVTEEVDGKTITKDTGEVIEIKGVKEVRKTKVNGKTKVELILDIGDGKEINAENVSYANKNDALIYEAIANLGDNIDADTANKLISKFDGGNAMVFARGITQAYTYGFYGLDRSEMKGKHTLSAELTEAQRNFAYGLGEKYRPVKDAKAKAEATVTKAPGEKGVYYRDKDGNATDIRTYLKETEIGLKDVQKTAIEVMEKMSEMMGVRFNVFESWVENGTRYYLDENGEVTEGNPNGFYDTATGEIYIDLNAGQDYQGTMLFTVAHELTHFMRQWSPEQFTKIAKIVFQHGGMKGSVAKLAAVKQAKAKAKGKPISYDTALEEVVADGMETILKDGKVLEFMEDVKKTDHEAWAKLKEWFQKLADFLKKLVDAYGDRSAYTVEGRKVAEFSENLLTQIKQILAEGALAGGQAYQMAIGNVKVSNDINIKEDSIDSSNTGISKQAKTGVKMQERTEFEAMPKQVFRVSTANGKAETNMLGTNKSVKELRDANFKKNGFTQEEIDKVNGFIKEMADNMAKYRLKYKFVGLQNIHDAKIILNPMTGKIVLSAMVNNSDYSVNFDFTKICKKRVALQEVLETLAREKGKVTDGKVTEVNLSPANIKKINDILASYGVETACLCCFVESKRYNIQNYYQEKVVDVWNAIVDEVSPDAGYFNFADSDVDTGKIPDSEFAELEMQMKEWAGKTGKAKNVEQKMREFLYDSPAARKKLRFSDLVTANGRTNLHKLYPEIESLILSKLGQSAPKSVEAFTPYNGEIDLLEATSNGDIVKYLYSIAGVRSQSFSDFMIAHVFDVLQKTASMSARKMPAHVYTKEIARAILFGMTGEKHNMSVLHNVDPDVDSWSAGLSKDGEYNFSDYEAYKKGYSEFVQSIGWKDAVTLQNTEGYSKDCGIIGVGFSYNHMLKLHNDPEVRQVIGYHTSQMPVEVKPLTHLDKAADYTDVQNTKAFVGFAKPNYAIPEGVPSYATPPQDVTYKGSKTKKVADTFDIVGTFNKLSKGKTGDARTAAAKETLRQLLEYANDHGYVITTASGEAGKGEFDLYGDVQKTQNPYLTTDHYIEYCIERGMLPMFYEFSMNPNYYKDIFDFNVFDRKSYNPETGLHEDSEGRKAYAPQTAVHMLNEDGSLAFPENFFDVVDKQMSSYNRYMQDVDSKMPSIMDEVRAVTNSTTLMSERVSNTELAEMADTALYIKNSDKANYIGMIFNGTKTEETRSRRTLDAFIGKEFFVTDGVYVYGSIVLGKPHKYTEAEFRKLENRKKHRVPTGDEYDIKPGGTKWAYPIESYKKFVKPKKLSDSTEYKHSFQARQILYADKANLSKSEYDRLVKKKPIKVSDQEMALIRTQRKTEYSSLDENDIPIIDFFRIGDYRIVDNGFLYYIRNSGPDNFTVVMRKQIVPDVRRITREVIKDENRSNDARTDQSAGQERGKRGLDRSGGDRTGNGRELSENDGGNGQSGESQRDLHAGQGDADSRTLKLRRIQDLSARIKALEKKLKSDRFTRAKKNEYRRELRKVRAELRELITVSHDNAKMSDRDSTYLDAVKRGDMETAQRMVDEDAKDAGFPVRLFHGTSKFGFTKVDVTQSDDGISFFVSDNFDVAASYIPYYEGSEAYDRVREIGKRSKEEGKVLTARSSVDELLDFLRKRYPDQYADSHIIKENERAKYIEHYVSDAARYARELLQYSVPQNVEDLATSVIDAETDRSKWNALANSYKEFKGIHEITYNGSYFSQASDVWYTLQDRIRLLDLYANGELAIVRGIPESKETLFYHYENATQGENVGIYGLYGKEDGQLVIRGRGSNWNNIPLGEIISDFNDWWTNVKGYEPSDNGLYTRGNTRNIAEFAKYRGYRSVVFEDIYDTGHYGYQSELSTVYAYFFPQEDIKSADPITYDDNGNIIPLSQRFNTEKDDIRYSDRDYVAYDRTAILKEETVARWLRAYATKSTPNYAQAYIAYMNPDQFLELTTSGYAAREYIESESYELDEEKFVKATSDQPLFLDIDHETGEVYGHEGRHRCVALQKAGIDSVPVLLFDTSNKYSKGDISSLLLKGQFNKYHREFVFDAVPLSYENQDRVVQNFATQSSSQRFWEKTGTKNTLRFQDRDEDSVSNRSLLANAFEGLAKDDTERKKIQEYKSKIALINEEEKKLRELNNQIKELSFSKGPRDTKKIKSLQFEANQAANRINTYDKQLLRLEASKPLQDVLAREKKKAYKKAEQRGKDALAAYKEKTAKTQRELLERWQDSRKKGIESRHKTAMRHKIKDVVNELNQYLLKGTKDRHVPESLQRAVAEALNAVNMDTVGAEERIAKLKEELLKAKTPEQIQDIFRRIDHIQEMGDKMNGRLKKLKDAYDDLLKSPDENTRNAYDEVIHNKLDSVIDKIGDTPLRDMTLAQLEDVYDMYRMVLKAIRDVNKSFKDAKKQSISTRANAVMAQVEEVGGKHKLSPTILKGIKKFGWNNLKPVYAFEHIGSITLTEAFNNVRAGEDTWALDIVEAREFYLDKTKKYHYDSWDFQKQYKFQSTSGMEFSLSLEQILSLYAYSKREQAADHLKYGGIVFDESTKIIKKTKLGISLEFNPTDATTYNISEETLADIISKLTDEQKTFADEMQDYLSTVMCAKGNEVSMEMYDVRLFKDKNYFPLKSAQQFMEKARDQQKGEVKIKNSGFSKETVPHAKNPIVLTPFMDVWANHVNEMSMYHAFVLPLEDFYRIYNYKTPSNNEALATEGVNQYIQNAYGRAATAYIDQLLKDLNGGARSDSTTGIINKMIGLFKKGSVFASLSVVVQQPSAIARAAALVDTKYFIGPKVDHKRHKALWEEVKQYAPVAIIKEMGYFDTNMGKSTQDFIQGKEYSGFKEKIKALVVDSDYRDELLSKAPSLADEIAWCGIWEAVKRETKAKNPGMDVKSEEFLKKAGERFTEVITKTQVYDSILSRSGLMRSKDTGMKMATAFMAEPTTSINMIADALLQGKRGNKKYARAAIGAVIASQIINSILVSFVYAGRDDDEEETYWEKYIGTLSGEILDSLNPAGYIPFIKDIMSIVQGYDVERSDMSVVSDLWKSIENLSKDNMSAYRKVEGFAGSIAQIFGLPVKNIMRDARGIYQTIVSFVSGQQTTAAGIWYAVKGAITGKDTSDAEQLYEAYLSGDATQIARVKSRFKDQSSVNTAIRKAIKDHYEAGDINLATAEQYLVKFGGMDKDDAYWEVGEWEYETDTGEEFQKYNNFYTAVQTGKNLKAVIKEYTDNGVDSKTLASQITSHFKPLYQKMSNAERAAIKGYLLNAYALLGYDRTKKSKDIDKWIED